MEFFRTDKTSLAVEQFVVRCLTRGHSVTTNLEDLNPIQPVNVYRITVTVEQIEPKL